MTQAYKNPFDMKAFKAPNPPKATVFISNLRTCQGELYGFRFTSRQPRVCKVPTCNTIIGKAPFTGTVILQRTRLAASNKSGFCIHHCPKSGRRGNKKIW